MAARPSARLVRAGALNARDKLWAAIRAFSAGKEVGRDRAFSPADVMALSGVGREVAYNYVRGLTKAGYLQVVDGNRPRGVRMWECFHLALVRDVGVNAPNVTQSGAESTVGLGVQRMWDWVRVAKEFDCTELAHGISDAAFQVSENTARHYTSALAAAGYLAEVAPMQRGVRGKHGSGMRTRYRFIKAKNTGPRAPSIASDKSVIDNNIGKTVWTPKGDTGCKPQT